MGVTVTTKGLVVISGQIIPNTVWLGAVQQQVVAAEGDTPGFSELFREFKETMEKHAKDEKAWDALEDQIPEVYFRAANAAMKRDQGRTNPVS